MRVTEPDDAWTRLETENPGGEGVFRLRMFGESPLNVFAILELPQRKVGIQLDVNAHAVPPVGAYPVAAGFHCRAERVGSTTRVGVLLESPEFRGVFGEMCADVLQCVLRGEGNETKAVRQFVERIAAWRELFSGSGPQPLREREQTGLFGELTFFDTLLDLGVAPEMAVRCWRGPMREPHDFSLGTTHVEVKTTVAMESSAVEISSLKQLDDADVATLLVWHYRFVCEGRIAETLRMLVDRLRDRLDGGGAPVRTAFDDRLRKAGYFDFHAAEHYDHAGYRFHDARALRVGPGFPRLVRANVPGPVQGAVYDLVLDEVSPVHDVAMDDALAILRSAVRAL